MILTRKELRGIRILSIAGSGGMGTVYHGRVVKARRGLKSGTDVAVKVLHAHLANDPAALKRFKLEAGLGLSLRHPNIVRIFQVGSERVEGTPIHFLVQEFIRGVTLSTLLQETGSLGDPFLRKIARQMADALAEIHGKEIIHRDLKPANVFLEPEGKVKLVDFGFSLVERRLKMKESASGFLGTVAYASPERFGPSRAMKASDLYSMGVILYELATGRNPFLGPDLASTIEKHGNLVPEEPKRVNPSISPFMSLLIMSLLKKEPMDRLGSASRLARILAKGEMSRWWRTVGEEAFSGPVSFRRQRLTVSRRTPVFGRNRESACLLGLMDEVIAGRGSRAVCLLGEAGSGKTRLVDRLLEEMDRTFRPGRVLVMEAAQGSVKIPFYPLLSALQAALDLKNLERDALRRLLERRMKAVLPERARAIERFTRFMISVLPESGLPAEILPHEQIVCLVGDLFQAMADKVPLLLVVENIGEADPPTFRLVADLLGRFKEARILTILTARPEASCPEDGGGTGCLDDLFASMAWSGANNLIRLERLSRSSVTHLLRAFGFPEKVASGPFGARVFSITEGNPYFVSEIARLVVAENRLGEEGVDWQGLQDEIPSSIQDVFYRRLFRISTLERQFLDFASVIGMRFTMEEVVEGLGMDFRAAARAVSRLQNRFALIRPVNGLFRFDHILIRDLLYNSIDAEQRMRYHLQAGMRYDNLSGGRPLTGREHYKAAVHFSRAREHRGALAHFQKAFDYLRYKHFHERAFQLAESAMGHIADLRALGEELIPSVAADAHLKQAEVAGYLGRREVQFRALRAALQEARKAEAPALLYLVRLRIGQYYHATSRFISAINFIESALEGMRSMGDRRGEADALHTLYTLLRDMGTRERLMDHLRQAYTLRLELKDRTGQAALLVDMGEYYLEEGRPAEARTAMESARQMFRNLRDERGLAYVQLGLARIEIEAGSLPAAEEFLKEGFRIAREVGDAVLEADVQGALGTCFMKKGELEKAEAAYSEALRLASMIQDVARRIQFLEGQARVLAQAGHPGRDREKALSSARQAVRLSREADLRVRDRARALNTLAAVFLEMDRPLSAFAILRKARNILKQEGWNDELGREIDRRYEDLKSARG